MYSKKSNKSTHKKIRKLRRKFKNIDLLVFKKTHTGVIGYSKPCCNCIRTMKYFGINKVYYSTGTKDENNICILKCERVSKIQNTYQSQIIRNFKLLN